MKFGIQVVLTDIKKTEFFLFGVRNYGYVSIKKTAKNKSYFFEITTAALLIELERLLE